MITTVDNFQGKLDTSMTKKMLRQLSGILGYKGYLSSRKRSTTPVHVTLADYKARKSGNILLDVFAVKEKNDDDLIIFVSKKEDDTYNAQAGNYVGKFIWGGLEIDIRSRFPEAFMKRMLNVANDVFLDDVSILDASVSKNLDFYKFVIYHMFIQRLEKAFLLGIPKAYCSIQHHDMKLRGRIDINRFIKHDIPFQGKISSVSREQKETQEIIDVLYKAVQVIDGHGEELTKNITRIKTHLKQRRSNQYVSHATIQKAMASKALQNPIFIPYKSVLEYAKLIIDANNLEENIKGTKTTFTFLVNVAELFELYITKLLQKEFPDWSVESPSLRLDKQEFGDSYLYKRRIIPDIVMQHRESNKIMVFDTKYKRMIFHKNSYDSGNDIDRCDFFQINTYMNYYNNQNQYNLIAGGLLYPMEAEFESEMCHANNWFGNKHVQFVVDGIDLSNLEENPNIQEREQAFIKRIKEMVSPITDLRNL